MGELVVQTNEVLAHQTHHVVNVEQLNEKTRDIDSHPWNKAARPWPADAHLFADSDLLLVLALGRVHGTRGADCWLRVVIELGALLRHRVRRPQGSPQSLAGWRRLVKSQTDLLHSLARSLSLVHA